MGGTYTIYARRKDNERYVLVEELNSESMDTFKHHVIAYAMEKKHEDKKCLYYYKGYGRRAKAIVKENYLEITFNSLEIAEDWDTSEEKLNEIPWLFRDFSRSWKAVNVEYCYMRVYQKI
jgi:hypothetical protein